MMQGGVINDFEPEVIVIDRLYDVEKNIFGIDELPEDEIKAYAHDIA